MSYHNTPQPFHPEPALLLVARSPWPPGCLAISQGSDGAFPEAQSAPTRASEAKQ